MGANEAPVLLLDGWIPTRNPVLVCGNVEPDVGTALRCNDFTVLQSTTTAGAPALSALNIIPSYGRGRRGR